MTWFKTDDKFWSHPKVMDTALSLAARGLWLTAGSYCADQLTDGLVRVATLHTIAPGNRVAVERAAAELVTAGLWEVVPGVGWQFHDWDDHQPTRSEVEAERAASKERQRRSRERRRAEAAAAASAPNLRAVTP